MYLALKYINRNVTLLDMSNMHHTVNYPYVEHFYGDGIITFWFRLGTELAAQLPLIVRHKVNFTYAELKRK